MTSIQKRSGNTKKSVSFIDKESSKKEKELSIVDNVVPSIKNPISVIPFHNLIIIYGMFKFGITKDVESIMLKSYITSIPIQFIYNYIIFKHLPKKNSTNVNLSLLLISSIFISLVLAIPLHVILVLFGAPIYKYSVKTFYLSLHLSQLIFSPLIILYTLDLNQFTKLFKLDNIYSSIFTNSILSMVLLSLGGCWLGVIPIPLDWDRPWQQWPITLLVGGYIGGFIGSLISLIKYIR
ncbi:unnamed protein product [Candida verbasci]|uniref:Glycosylphosphatidylinositol anchor biosynthesis protein 11 n=1 Tax=Candida verbasci TaxID=1227364 RepID=A0A9W4U0U6_9ASCO|nr:unnamed protein product [Candida verbasci]